MTLKDIVKYISKWYEVYEDNKNVKSETEKQLEEFLKLID